MGLFKPNIQKMEREKDVDGLLKLLRNEDPALRANAARALGCIGAKRALKPLEDCLRDIQNRLWAAESRALRFGEDEKAIRERRLLTIYRQDVADALTKLES